MRRQAVRSAGQEKCGSTFQSVCSKSRATVHRSQKRCLDSSFREMGLGIVQGYVHCGSTAEMAEKNATRNRFETDPGKHPAIDRLWHNGLAQLQEMSRARQYLDILMGSALHGELLLSTSRTGMFKTSAEFMLHFRASEPVS